MFIMKSIMVSDDMHKWLMDNKNSVNKSAESVIQDLIDKNDIHNIQ